MFLLPVWYFLTSGTELGPVTYQTLKVLAGRGLLQPDTLVKRKRSNHWGTADSVEGLFRDASTTRSETNSASTKSPSKVDGNRDN